MSDASRFTLSLFDSSALGWTLSPPAPPPDERPDPADEREDEPEGPHVGARSAQPKGANLYLDSERALARGWRARALDNIAAIRLSKELEQSGRTPTPAEQQVLLRFTGFGATDLAQNCFRLPGAATFREGWEEAGQDLAAAVGPDEYAALQRATQYAHYTPEPVARALWRAAERLGFNGGRVLEPGMGTGLVFSMLPPALRDRCRLTGVEYDPVTARIARLVHPEARVRCEDYTRSRLGGGFDLAIGNPPFSDRVVRADPSTASLGLRLHDWFIASSIARLRPDGLAIFVTSTGTMDKVESGAREHIGRMADLVGAVRLPEASLRATAGTDVVVDMLVFQRRAPGQAGSGPAWTTLAEAPFDDAETEPSSVAAAPRTTLVNEYFVRHPEMVLGDHGLAHGRYGLAYTCRARAGDPPLPDLLNAAIDRLPAAIFTPSPDSTLDDEPEDESVLPGPAAQGTTVKEGSYLVSSGGRLMQVIDGAARPVAIRDGKGGTGIPARHAKIIRALLPVRDAVREVLRAQAADLPWAQAQVRLRVAYSGFIRYYGPINHTVVTVATDPDTGEDRETHRRPNLACLADDPDCWLVASIEDYDLESGLARMGPIFRDRVIAPPAAPLITSAADALAVTLAEKGGVDLEYLSGLLETDQSQALADLGTTVFRNPRTEAWETNDAYLSGAVRIKLAVAEAAAATDPSFERNVAALRDMQPVDLRPSDITARLGAPWMPTDVIEAFAFEVMQTRTRITHCVEIASWSVDAKPFAGTALGTSEWGTHRRNAGALLHDALGGATPQIFDLVVEDGTEKRVLNVEATEAAKEKLVRIKTAFADWVWTCPDRADRLSRIYNDGFNNLVPRRFDGRHLTLPGASSVIRLYDHQKRAIWRVIADGSTYIAHAVGAGKTFTMAAAVMEQKRLGLISKAMMVVPGHCLAQASREFLQLYPTARILVADETNFTKDKRARFLARAATATWDAIVITHSAFKFIAVPADFEREMIEVQIAEHEAVAIGLDADDRTTRKRIEAMKEKLSERLRSFVARRDDMLTIEEIGIDQVFVDEAQEFRKLSFSTNRTNLKGVDPDGSQRAWDLFVKSRWLDRRNPSRALIQASGTPITNTLGEMFTVLRFQAEAMLRERGIQAFDAWASAFGDTRTELELQPSGTYKPVERFSEFINVPELIDMFRSIADVVLKEDLRGYLKLPRIRLGERQLVTAPPSEAFRAYQRHLADRIRTIETRRGKPRKGDDILLSAITDGRHAAIDMRLVWPANDDEPDSKLNALIANAHRIWVETEDRRYRRPDGMPYPIAGAGQLIFSDLGTIAVEAARGFSAYRWIKQELVRRGVPASQIAFMQDSKKSADKQRLFNEFNTGRIRFLIGSSDTMGTGVNVQQRLKALHHLDVPWLPSQIEQREGRIERQGNQNDEIELYAYATLGSMDATMWQNNERKARFVAAALSGDRTIRRLEDVGSQASQFAMAKAIASGDGRLMLKAGLESEIARLDRQRAAHFDDQVDVRRRLAMARRDEDECEERITAAEADVGRRIATRADAFAMTVAKQSFTDRKLAGASLLSKARLGALERNAREHAIGGFDLTCVFRRDRHSPDPWPEICIERAGGRQAVALEDSLTPLGLVARIEHMLASFETEIEDARRKRADAVSRVAGYGARIGQAFALQGELDEKLARLAELDADLAKSEGVGADIPRGLRSRAA